MAQVGDVAANAVVAHEASLFVKPGRAADRKILCAAIRGADFVLEMAKRFMPLVAGNVLGPLRIGDALDGQVPAPLAQEETGFAAQLLHGVSEETGETKFGVLFPEPVGGQVGKIGQRAGAQFDLAFCAGVGSAQGRVGTVFFRDVRVGGNQAAVGQAPVHDGQHRTLGPNMLEGTGLACLHTGHPARDQMLQFGGRVAGIVRIVSHQRFQRKAVVDQGFGHPDQLQEPPVPHHQPQLFVEQGDALVNMVDRVVQAGEADAHRLAGLAQHFGQATCGCGMALAGVGPVGGRCAFFLPHLQQRGDAKAYKARQRAHCVQRPGDGKAGHALAAQVDPHVDAFAHGGRACSLLRGDAVLVECALQDALCNLMRAANAPPIAGRHDAPRLAHEAAHQTQLCVEHIAEILAKGEVESHGHGILCWQ